MLLSKALKTAQLEIEMLLDFFQRGPQDMPKTKSRHASSQGVTASQHRGYHVLEASNGLILRKVVKAGHANCWDSRPTRNYTAASMAFRALPPLPAFR